jgi:hypothetical protein
MDISLITPSYDRDLERCALLCETVDRFVTGFTQHYIVVADVDYELFRPFAGVTRQVVRASRLLPAWLRPAPRLAMRHGRKLWWSWRALPVNGWHVQQILKIASVLAMPGQRFCLLDSDIAFFRRFDLASFAGGALSPLYASPAAIAADAPLHSVWARNADLLLGNPPTVFPADDYIGHVLIWDRASLAAMTARIEQTTGLDWPLALCRRRAFSEYLLYAQFVAGTPTLATQFQFYSDSLAISCWDDARFDALAVAAMIAGAPEGKVALSIPSFSENSPEMIRDALRIACSQARNG